MQHADYDLGFGDFQLAKFDLTKNNVSTFWTQIGTIKLEDGNELKLCFRKNNFMHHHDSFMALIALIDDPEKVRFHKCVAVLGLSHYDFGKNELNIKRVDGLIYAEIYDALIYPAYKGLGIFQRFYSYLIDANVSIIPFHEL